LTAFPKIKPNTFLSAMSTREIIRKLQHHKKNTLIDKLITILELCDFNHLPLESIEDLLTIDEVRLLTVVVRGILKEKGELYTDNPAYKKMDRPMDELMCLFNGLCV
jgi:hypothetical protein